MKRALNTWMGLMVLLLAAACDLSSNSGEDLLGDLETEIENAGVTPAADSDPEPTPAPAPRTAPQPPSTGYGGFLWKPVSESTRNLVVLTPHAATHGKTLGFATISGSFGSERASMRHEHHNGNRPHFYFSQPGAAYGTQITVQVPLQDGSIYSVVVPNGASRTE